MNLWSIRLNFCYAFCGTEITQQQLSQQPECQQPECQR